MQASCGCVAPVILASGSEVAAGSTLPSEGLVSLRVKFRPKAGAGKKTETVRIRYKEQGSSAESVQSFRFSCEILPAVSLLEQAFPTTIDTDAPVRKLQRILVLRKPISVREMRQLNRDSPAWLHLFLGAGESVDKIRMEIRDLDIVRDVETELKIPYSEGTLELVTLRLHLRAKAKLEPGGVTELVRLGSKLELPIRMRGGAFSEQEADLVLHKLHEVGGREGKEDALPRISFRIDRDPASPTFESLILIASGFSRAGAYEAELLVRPKESEYRLPLPIFFRVIGAKQQ